MLASFSPRAREVIIRAGVIAADCGQGRLGDGFLLLALAEGEPLARPVELGVTASGIRAAIEARSPRRRDRELLATLGIDLDEVRRRAVVATGVDDPARWRLRRSPVRPLRVTLSGPATQIVLDEGGRKVIEVARWASRRGHRPQAEREDLLWGLLADGRSESVRILRRSGADLSRLGADLRRWHRCG
jgi:Clp amino terminal domain, pathogenicity island component